MTNFVETEVNVSKSVIFLTRCLVMERVSVTVAVRFFTLVFVVGDTLTVTTVLVSVIGSVTTEVCPGSLLVAVETLTVVKVETTFFGFTFVMVLVWRLVVVMVETIVTGLTTVTSTVVTRSDTVVTTFLTTFLVVETTVTGRV